LQTRTRAAGRYRKEISFELLAPESLLGDLQSERQFSEQAVSFQRFKLEVETLCRMMREIAADAKQMRKLPLAFFDSSIVISFVEQLHDGLRQQYVDLVLQLMRCSEETRVPVIGYVATSHARDLAKLLALCFDLREAERVHDAQLLSRWMTWGARSPFYICARGGSRSNQKSVLESFGEYRRKVGFVYLKTSAAAPPARLEIPLWVYEAGLLEEVLDLVRAEVIVGNGYPYALETADATAVISGRDTRRFTTSCNASPRLKESLCASRRRWRARRAAAELTQKQYPARQQAETDADVQWAQGQAAAC
jgi:hypothetical protein